ncbi:alkaline phosphatase family [Fusarium acutatum]|uniref:Alkaline phosphatase family n=1 Tax=Fusarium acutatum TaxID=78861 RepID=A0A8H4K4J8_9HYPO|nr:alkaline phosphatase family [Fusarium acutatum]
MQQKGFSQWLQNPARGSDGTSAELDTLYAFKDVLMSCRPASGKGISQTVYSNRAVNSPNIGLASPKLSSEHCAALFELDQQRQEAQPDGSWSAQQTLVIIDDTEEVIRSFGKEDGRAFIADESDDDTPQHSFPEHDESTSTVFENDASSHEAFFRIENEEARNENASLGSLESDTVGQDRAFHHLHQIDQGLILSPPDLATTPLFPAHWMSHLPFAPFSLGQAISRGVSPQPEPRFPVSQSIKVHLMSAYIRETATWCETTDSEMHFSAKSIHQMMDSKPFVAAAMSLASRQLDVIQGRTRHITLELYQYAIRLLLGHDPAEADSCILATCTILCVYEMMASSVSEWRRHLKGCAGLLRMRKWNGNSMGIVKTCFWAFARIDVWAAFLMDQTTLIPTDSWVDQDSLFLVAEKGDPDDYCNLAILIFAKIINVLNSQDSAGVPSITGPRDKVHALWEELQRWRCWRPQNVKPLLRDDSSDNSPFPTIVFALYSSICGNTFYHAGSILLLQSGLVTPNPTSDVADVLSPVWHARELGGISTTNPSHANWVNHLQPLYIAGTAFAGSPKQSGHGSSESWSIPTEAEDYAVEKIALLKHLAKIERETGWRTTDRAKDLRILWDLEN